MFNIEPRDWEPIYSDDFVYSSRNLSLKYAVDKGASVLMLLALLPLLILISLSVLVEALVLPKSGGPTMISQERISEGKPFLLYKFRTYYLQDDDLHADKKGTTDFINDRDLTFVGTVLRKFYLDELPQLINIIKGDMSFIGPRPVPENQFVSTLKQGFQAKRVLRAGLGGPVQALKGHWRKIGPYLAYDEDLISQYQESTSIGVVLLDLKSCWQNLKKIWDADGLESPTR